jgi:hypothetical protein
MKGIQPERITTLNDAAVRNGDWVLYWMQQSQRAHDNPALEYAIHRANPGPARAGGLRTDRQLPGGQPAPLPLHAGGTGRNPGAAGQAPHRMVVRKGRRHVVARLQCDAIGAAGLRCGLHPPSARWRRDGVPIRSPAARWPWRETWSCPSPSYRQKPSMPLAPSDPRSTGIWSSLWCPAPGIGRNGIRRYQNGRHGSGFHRRSIG